MGAMLGSGVAWMTLLIVLHDHRHGWGKAFMASASV